jgi:hypothetical protein
MASPGKRTTGLLSLLGVAGYGSRLASSGKGRPSSGKRRPILIIIRPTRLPNACPNARQKLWSRYQARRHVLSARQEDKAQGQRVHDKPTPPPKKITRSKASLGA